MSSIDITSTNDMTSTAAASEVSGSFAGDSSHHVAAHTLTTDAIIRECIKQGFYRNPICNEKLYLHNRGFDSVAATAFEPYTDVKVLWLEGNGFSSLPCGSHYTQVRPPVRVDPFADLTEEPEKEQRERADDGDAGAATEHHADPTSLDRATSQSRRDLPLSSEVPSEKRDAFSSLYPTVRQLYLHNNLFREMPDLSRFERLDSVNLSGNFFAAIESHCVYWQRKKNPTCGIDTPVRDGSAELHASDKDVETKTKAEEKPIGNTNEIAVLSSAADAKAQRAQQLDDYRRTAEAAALFCEHCPLPEREEEERATAVDAHGRPAVSVPYVPRQPPLPDPEYRNLCSSLRSLNVAGNRLETFEDCLGLLSFKALAVLDLSHNNIQDGEALLLILERLPRLQSLKLSGNPLVRTLPRYRKRLLSRCKQLLYLDDRPVFAEERRLVTAWALAGDDGEEKERALLQAEKAAAEKKRLDDFRRLIARHQHDAAASDYVSAVTTSAALATTAAAAGGGAAAGTAGVDHGSAPGGRTHRRRQAPPSRRPSSDPDNSPTSSESDSDSDAEGEPVARVGGTQTPVLSHAERAEYGAGVDRIAPEHVNVNKPSRAAATRERTTRVLSSNQRVESAVVVSGSVQGQRDHVDDEAEEDIFVPES